MGNLSGRREDGFAGGIFGVFLSEGQRSERQNFAAGKMATDVSLGRLIDQFGRALGARVGGKRGAGRVPGGAHPGGGKRGVFSGEISGVVPLQKLVKAPAFFQMLPPNIFGAVFLGNDFWFGGALPR